MEISTLSKRTIGFGLAVSIVCILNAVIVVLKEKSKAVMSAMKSVLGHHWTTHATLVIVLFLVLGSLFTALRSERGSTFSANRLVGTLVSCVVLAVVIIVGFYLLGD